LHLALLLFSGDEGGRRSPRCPRKLNDSVLYIATILPNPREESAQRPAAATGEMKGRRVLLNTHVKRHLGPRRRSLTLAVQ
jgi:hypothetical protein